MTFDTTNNTAFLPSRNGLAFTNSWPAHSNVVVSDVVVDVPVLGNVVIGDASRGLCGGMVFAALDVFTAALPPPSEPQPAPGTVWFDYIVRRLIDSWHVPTGVAKYYEWMTRPDHTSETLGITTTGVAAWTIDDEWPKVKATIDADGPAALGVITVETNDPRRLGDNHQVLAYGYEVSGDHVTIKVYDPNTDRANGDGVFVAFDLGDPGRSAHMSHNIDINPDHHPRGFFVVEYEPATPPG